MIVKCSAEDCANNRLGMCCKEAVELIRPMASRVLVVCDDYERSEQD